MKKRFLAVLLALTLSLTAFSVAGYKTRGEQDYDRMVAAGKFFFEHYLDATPTGDPIKAWLTTMFEKDETLADQLINIMYQTWDPHSYYLKNQVHEEAFDFRNLTVGIGIGLSETAAGTVTITNVIVGGPADTAGLKVGDIIAAVNGRDVTGYTLKMVGDLIRGAEGTAVTVKVRRGGGLYSHTAKRTTLPISTVSAVDHGGGVGYIKVTNFHSTETFMDFTVTYDEFYERGLDTVIVDLRDNLGGTMDCASNILNYIIPERGIPYLRLRYAAPTAAKTAVSTGVGRADNKLIILVNEYTASASEIMAGVLQDLGYAELVGTKTRGKGSAQAHYPIDPDHTAVITRMEILLPVSGSYNHVGLSPDHPIELYESAYQMPNLTPLDLKSGIHGSKNVRAVEERLHELGYFEFAPDDVADFRTWHGVEQFCRANELPHQYGTCDAKTVVAIDDAMKVLAETPVITDLQFQKALMLARAYAARGNPPEPIDKDEITFGSK